MKVIQVFEGEGIDPDKAEHEIVFDATNICVASGTGPHKDHVTFEVDMKEQATRIYNEGTILRLQQLEAGKFKIALSLRTSLVSGGYLSWHLRTFTGVPTEVTAQHIAMCSLQGRTLAKRVKVLLCR